MCKNIKNMAIKQIYLEYFPYFCKKLQIGKNYAAKRLGCIHFGRLYFPLYFHASFVAEGFFGEGILVAEIC